MMHPPPLRTTHASTAPGLEHLEKLVAFVQETGRYPSRAATSDSERSLAVWLQHRREEARNGTLAPAYHDGLAALSGWQTREGRRPTRHGGKHGSLHWLSTGQPATTGHGTRPTWKVSSTASGCGCTTSGPSSTAVNSTRPVICLVHIYFYAPTAATGVALRSRFMRAHFEAHFEK
jgi:hypothetical protein